MFLNSKTIIILSFYYRIMLSVIIFNLKQPNKILINKRECVLESERASERDKNTHTLRYFIEEYRLQKDLYNIIFLDGQYVATTLLNQLYLGSITWNEDQQANTSHGTANNQKTFQNYTYIFTFPIIHLLFYQKFPVYYILKLTIRSKVP